MAALSMPFVRYIVRHDRLGLPLDQAKLVVAMAKMELDCEPPEPTPIGDYIRYLDDKFGEEEAARQVLRMVEQEENAEEQHENVGLANEWYEQRIHEPGYTPGRYHVTWLGNVRRLPDEEPQTPKHRWSLWNVLEGAAALRLGYLAGRAIAKRRRYE